MDARGAADLKTMLQAALGLVAADGLRGLSLRSLAELIGASAPALIRRFGGKDALVERLIEAAIAEEGAFLDQWVARIRDLDVRDGARLVEVADAVLSDLAGPEALRTQFYCELLQALPSRPELAEAVAAWSDRRLAFWRAATGGLAPSEMPDILHAFSIGEAAYGLALGDLAAYRWLRRLSLRRLCCGLIPSDTAQDMREYAVFRAALGDLLDAPDQATAAPMTDWQASVAGCISSLIIAEGADAVTHRAIAARAGLANSTLAYHFPRQEDLLRAGVADIVDRVHRATAPPSNEAAPDFQLTAIESARATFAIALVATRMPGLKGIAADLRRRRGENSVGYLERQLGEPVFDVVSAQAMSLTGMGRLTLDGVLDPASNNAASFELTDRMRKAALAAR